MPRFPNLKKNLLRLKSENVKLKQIIEENVKCDIRVEELEQKNKELEARLSVVEQSSVVVDGQPQNDSRSEDANASKEAILEILPEVSADVVDQLKKHAPVCKANDVVSEVLPEVNSKLLEEREMDKFLNETHKKNVSNKIRQNNKKLQRDLTAQDLATASSGNDQSHYQDEIDVVDTSQIIEQGLIQELIQN
ncbi:4259_t:CDS:2 [Ambispora gerdemannii]|uniref:4259_t:CDS:1 n=1 Tax=Ambispora gerdemannii TaxID=144530 RepID=A0A9N8WGD8_9GLOM|nr:4259_t:CDS:2 [Ambispora gerdemannii]